LLTYRGDIVQAACPIPEWTGKMALRLGRLGLGIQAATTLCRLKYPQEPGISFPVE
jgi:hypothetical protein